MGTRARLAELPGLAGGHPQSDYSDASRAALRRSEASAKVDVIIIIISRRGGSSSARRFRRSLLLPPAGSSGQDEGEQGEAGRDRCAATCPGGRSTALGAAGGGRERAH